MKQVDSRGERGEEKLANREDEQEERSLWQTVSLEGNYKSVRTELVAALLPTDSERARAGRADTQTLFSQAAGEILKGWEIQFTPKKDYKIVPAAKNNNVGKTNYRRFYSSTVM